MRKCDKKWLLLVIILVQSHSAVLVVKIFQSDLKGKSKNKWILTDPIENKQLKRMMQIPIIRHTMIKHTASPYDVTLRIF